MLAGYSGTPLPKKLGIKPGARVGLLGAPDDFERTLGSLPPDVSLVRRPRGACDLLLWFVTRHADLARGVTSLAQRTGRDGVWICWPKKASGVATDVTQDAVRALGLAHGLVDYKIAAIDATWSGLKFAVRKG
ncbi:MAG: DUF3052 domain-containing protein [Planctomycetes bacterium]|nr:DUF3052 domain-containing protein [Planctomycetota bacterium]